MNEQGNVVFYGDITMLEQEYLRRVVATDVSGCGWIIQRFSARQIKAYREDWIDRSIGSGYAGDVVKLAERMRVEINGATNG